MAVVHENEELSSLLRLWVSKACNHHQFWSYKEIRWCRSVELWSLFCFPGSNIGALEQVGAGYFLCSHGSGLRSCRTVVTFDVLGLQDANLFFLEVLGLQTCNFLLRA